MEFVIVGIVTVILAIMERTANAMTIPALRKFIIIWQASDRHFGSAKNKKHIRPENMICHDLQRQQNEISYNKINYSEIPH